MRDRVEQPTAISKTRFDRDHCRDDPDKASPPIGGRCPPIPLPRQAASDTGWAMGFNYPRTGDSGLSAYQETRSRELSPGEATSAMLLLVLVGFAFAEQHALLEVGALGGVEVAEEALLLAE